MRLFPKVGRGTVLFDESISDPSQAANWRSLIARSDGPSLIELGSLAASNASKKLPATQVHKAIVRIFDVPAGQEVECLARFSTAEARASGDCPLFFVVPLPVPAKDQAASPVPDSAEDLEFAWEHREANSQSAWSDDLDATRATVAFRPLEKSSAPRRFAAIFPDVSDKYRLLGLQVRPHYKWDEVSNASRLADARIDGPLSRRVKAFRLAGEVRRCIYLEANSKFAFDARPRQDADSLELSLAIDPVAKAPACAAVEVSIETGPGQMQSLGTKSIALETGAEPIFETMVVALPPKSKDEPAANRDLRVRIAVTGDCGVLVGEPMLRQSRATGRKNLLLVSIDTLRRDSLGCYGYSRPTSPFLDEFSKRGARFDSVMAVAPYTLPTHASMLTGLMPPRHGAMHTSDRLVTDRVPYLPHLMRAAGYHTAAFTGGGFVSDGFGFDAGFDRYTTTDPIRGIDERLDGLPKNERSLRGLQNIDAAASWIDSRGEEPWFLFLHTFAVHEYTPPGRDMQLFDTKPEVTPNRVFPKWLLEQTWQKEPPSPGDLVHIRDRYDATIHYVDRRLGDLLKRLEASGKLKNTVVAIVSDHGEEFMEHGGLRHSVTLYEEMLQVPWILYAPSIGAGSVITEPVSQVDLMPTLLELVDIERPANLDGHSRVPALRGDRAAFIDTPLFAQIASPFSRRTALRRGTWKLIENGAATYSDGATPVPPNELFNLKDDPHEQKNVEKSEAKALSNVSAAMTTIESYLRLRAVGKVKAQVDSELDERLRQLGYVR